MSETTLYENGVEALGWTGPTISAAIEGLKADAATKKRRWQRVTIDVVLPADLCPDADDVSWLLGSPTQRKLRKVAVLFEFEEGTFQ